MGKVEIWTKQRRKLKIEYEKRGITTCELRFPGCWFDNALGFAHRYKRSDPRCEHTFKGTILACNPCHDKIEYDRELTRASFNKLRGILYE
ncbi:MAG: hypothetical protein UV58_C0013G0014 [Candidatus Wolfebacteria bacterium GW2011_GWC1_43_10]|uniref:Uncharacterized protein n=1 Tax=Candidatus Wolfebacteria bacterium GW2011_GWC1_43_10 TaxID=1619011 RepID=A0A0G1EGA9_9BACT|nr:MAG: hypothetical protein UV58_C0013G0014 [Candidatus Wolfebacteria bacterium GW2011_GWC1_43_10]HZX13025.1 hypothetical protein [Thermodesulfobacteriota bacterium]